MLRTDVRLLPPSAATLLLAVALSPVWGGGSLWAQESTAGGKTDVADSLAKEQFEGIQEQMAASLAQLEELRRELAERELRLSEARARLAEVEKSGNEEQIEAARAALQLAERWVAGLGDEIEDQQALYDRLAGRLRIAREQASLTSGQGTEPSGNGGSSGLLKAVQRRGELDQAELAAELAEQRVESLRAEIEIIESRQEKARGDLDRINRRLDEGLKLDRQQRQEFVDARQRLLEDERRFDDRLTDLRSQLVLAEITLRLQQAQVEQELSTYRAWQRQLVLSLGLLLAAVVVVALARILVNRLIRDPGRRYSANRTLSLALTFVVLIGLGVIFLRQFPNLITGIGVVLAGVAIALQEVILSFFGFFAIRGARGYRIGDWIRIGDHHGEVVDLGLLVTTLEEVTPIEFQSQGGGAKTGALIWINNSAIFREKMTNYTRGFPYIWCTLTFTITFESDWQKAEEVLRDIITGHEEITTTAKLAHKRIADTTAELAIRTDDTSPRLRVWAADSGVSLRVRFMVHPRRLRALVDAVNREVLTRFMDSPSIDFAYTTARVIPTPLAAED